MGVVVRVSTSTGFPSGEPLQQPVGPPPPPAAVRARDPRATAAGVLLVVATAASLVATGLLGSVLDGPRFLAAVAQHEDRVLTAALFQLLGAFASPAIAMSLYPVLRRYAPATALGSVGFRLIEGTFYAVSAVGTVVLVSLAARPSSGRVADVAASASGELVRDLRSAAAVAGILAFYVGGTLYYLIFYRFRLVPRWLSGWGLAGTTLGFVAALLVLFRVTDTLSGTQVALNVPIGVQEMVLAVWLIWRGLALDAAAPARTGPG